MQKNRFFILTSKEAKKCKELLYKEQYDHGPLVKRVCATLDRRTNMGYLCGCSNVRVIKKKKCQKCKQYDLNCFIAFHLKTSLALHKKLSYKNH